MTPFSVHSISDQKVRTVMVKARVRVGDVVVRNVVGRKVGNHNNILNAPNLKLIPRLSKEYTCISGNGMKTCTTFENIMKNTYYIVKIPTTNTMQSVLYYPQFLRPKFGTPNL